MKRIKYSVLAVLSLAMTLFSCSDTMDWEIDPAFDRCFSATSLSVAAGTTDAIVSFDAGMMKSKGAEAFQIEVTSEAFASDEEWDNSENVLHFETETSPCTITGLIGDTEYYLRIRAISSHKTASRWVHYATDTKMTFKTDAEQIMYDVADADRGENSITVRWDATKEVTHLTVSDGTEEEGVEPMKIMLDDAAKAAGCYTVTGLNPSTAYTIAIYYNDAKRGSVSASTAAVMPAADFKYTLDPAATVIDQVLINDLSEQAKAVAGDPNNYSVTIALNANQEVKFYGTGEDGTPSNIKIPTGMSVTFFGLAGGDKPTMKFIKNIDVTGSHAYIKFQNVNIVDGGAGYFLNQSAACNVEEFTFDDCSLTGFSTTFFRVQNAASAKIFNKLNLINSVFTNISAGYSFIHMDTDGKGGSIINNIFIDGCTFNGVVKAGKCFIYSEKATMSGDITIKNSTFYNWVGNSQYIIDFNAADFGCRSISFENCLFGLQGDNTTSKTVRANVVPTYTDCYKTTDFFKKITDVNELHYSSDELFVDPANGNFSFKPNTTDLPIGDPRWRTE